MINKKNLEAVDTILRKIRSCDMPFGVIVFVGAGDFRQIPPIVRNSTRDDIVSSSIKFSPIWKHFKVYSLKISVRQAQDPVFADMVVKISDGTLQSNSDGKIILNLVRTTADLTEWISFVYPNLKERDPSTKGQALLTLLNTEVDQLNDRICAALPTEYVTLYSHDEIHESSEISEFFTDNVTAIK